MGCAPSKSPQFRLNSIVSDHWHARRSRAVRQSSQIRAQPEAAVRIDRMKQKIVIKSFGALSYELVLQRTETTAWDSRRLAPPRLRIILEDVEGPTALPGLGVAMGSGSQTSLRQGTAHFRGDCVRTLPALLESRPGDRPLTSGQTQCTPAPPADTATSWSSAGGST